MFSNCGLRTELSGWNFQGGILDTAWYMFWQNEKGSLGARVAFGHEDLVEEAWGMTPCSRDLRASSCRGAWGYITWVDPPECGSSTFELYELVYINTLLVTVNHIPG